MSAPALRLNLRWRCPLCIAAVPSGNRSQAFPTLLAVPSALELGLLNLHSILVCTVIEVYFYLEDDLYYTLRHACCACSLHSELLTSELRPVVVGPTFDRDLAFRRSSTHTELTMQDPLVPDRFDQNSAYRKTTHFRSNLLHECIRNRFAAPACWSVSMCDFTHVYAEFW